MLSMLAAIQAPVIMMSQNRAAAKDRQAAEHDYVVNLRSEFELMHLHDKFDAVREQQLEVADPRPDRDHRAPEAAGRRTFRAHRQGMTGRPVRVAAC